MTAEDRQRGVGDFALPAKRRTEMLQLIKRSGQVVVTEMSAYFDVSLDTIRRDLDAMAEQGLINRIHGGAVLADDLASSDTPFKLRVGAQSREKANIGRAAAELIANGETLIVNGGSTTLAFAGSLAERQNLTIVTNNLSLPSAVPSQAVSALYLLGGEIRNDAQITMGPVAFVGAQAINADTAVIGVGGVNVHGCSTSLLAEATMMLQMIAASRRTIIVADSSKFGRRAFAEVVLLHQTDVLVTDAQPPEDLSMALEAAGVRVIVAT
jgi:DeoR family glycerol-3-phosphate regulon repressor/DeoR family fructose operon transcriptional repressor